MVTDAGKFHIAVLDLCGFVRQLREVVGRLGVLVPAGSAEVYKEQFAVFLSFAEHDMFGVEVVVDEELEVEVLENCEQFQAYHQG